MQKQVWKTETTAEKNVTVRHFYLIDSTVLSVASSEAAFFSLFLFFDTANRLARLHFKNQRLHGANLHWKPVAEPRAEAARTNPP